MPRICPAPSPPPPPSASSAPSFSDPVAYHYPCPTLTRGIQGCPKTISLDKNIWHPTFEKSFQSSFFLPLCVRAFLQHLLPKMLSFFPPLNNPRIFPRFFFLLQLFSPMPNECQLFMPKDFLEPPCLTLLSEPLVLRERVKGGNR